MTTTEELLYFWFGTLDFVENIQKREIWFKSTPEFDHAIECKFMGAYELASENKLDNLIDDQASCLALIILLDQLPRNLFRHSARAYATDHKARSVAYHALDQKFDKNVSPWHGVFFYLPFEHSENINDQNLSVELFSNLNINSATEAAIGHREVIEKYGRFPYRNEALGRVDTLEEKEFLKEPPPWGKTKAEFDEMARKKVQAGMFTN